MHRRGLRLLVIAGLIGGPWSNVPAADAPRPDTPTRRTAVVDVVQRTKASVVNISAKKIVERSLFPDAPFGDLFEDFFGRRFGSPTREVPHNSLGTGFLASTAGTILTNHHVVARARQIRVTFEDGREFNAQVIGAAPDVDLALLELQDADPEQLPEPLTFAKGQSLIGETVIAIGNPFGLDHTVTTGVISARDRTFHVKDRTYVGVLQTDASINPGNSGGPLLNIQGRVAGVNTAIFQEAQGIGFAIAADVAERVLRELGAQGSVARSWLGVELQNIDNRLAETLGVERNDGVVVTRVVADAPAHHAGLREGDLLTHLGEHKIDQRKAFGALLATYGPGHHAVLKGRRNGQPTRWRVKPGTYDTARLDDWWRRIGVTLVHKRDHWRVQAVRKNSAAAKLGLRAGDAIVALDRFPVSQTKKLRRHLVRNRHKSYFLLGVARGRRVQHVGVQLPPPDPTY